MIPRLLPLLALLLAAPAAADPLEGSWALEVAGTPIFRFDLAKDKDGKWRGTWSKPSSFASDGNNFAHLKGPPKKVPSMTALETPDGVEISFNDPRPGAIPDIFDFKPIDQDAVEMKYVGTDLAPYTLERVKTGAALGPWDADKTYALRPATGATASPADNISFTAQPDARMAAERPAQPAPAAEQPAATPIVPSTFQLKPGAMTGR
jgi:hypothetical protein